MRVLFADISGDGAASLRGEVSRFMLRLAYLRDVKHWGDNNPLFPVTLFKLGDKQRFEVCGVDRAGWRNTSPIRAIFRRALEAAGLPYYHPHLFRKTLARIGLKRCRTAEELNAWSQKLSHEDVMGGVGCRFIREDFDCAVISKSRRYRARDFNLCRGL
jgi:hypothetical protein